MHIATAASGLTAEEYSDRFPVAGKKVSPRTIKRRCENGQLPSTHHAVKFLQDQWIIMVPDVEEVKPVRKESLSMNTKHFSFR